MYVYSFNPIASAKSKVLILGTMPSKTSLEHNQYYAHPRNYFWKLMTVVLNMPQSLSYQKRCEFLNNKGIALWDVFKSCIRASSLDIDIVESSITVNDIGGLLKLHNSIKKIFFNGSKAEQAFYRYIRPTLANKFLQIPCVKLTSTSPANASISWEEKIKSWSIIV